MVDTQPRKRPVQARARATFDAIVEASARILASEGPDALTTNRIAEVAGVSIGSLYQYFPSKEAIVGALVEHMLEHDRATMESLVARADALDLRAALHEFGTQICAHQYAVAPLLREILPLLPQVEREAVVEREINAIVGLFGAFITQRRNELRPELQHNAALLDDTIFVVGHGLRGALNAIAIKRPSRLLEPACIELLVRQLRAALLPDR